MEVDILIKRHKISAKMPVTVLCLILCLIVFHNMYNSYKEYQKNLTIFLQTSATDDLTESTKLAKRALQKNINVTYDKIQNLILLYKLNISNSDNTQYINRAMQECSNKNSLGTLSYISTQDMFDLSKKNDVSTSYKKVLHNLLQKREQIYVPNSSIYNIELAVPIVSRDIVRGALICSYTEQDLNNQFKETTFQGYGEATLITFMNNEIQPIYPNTDHTFSHIDEFTFFDSYSKEKVYNDLRDKNFAITHYKYNNESYYAYYMPLEAENLYVVNIIPAKYLESEALAYQYLANHYIVETVMNLGYILLIILALLALVFYHQRQYKIIQNLESQRFNTIIKHTKSAVWEYNLITDVLTKSNADFGINIGKNPLNNASIYFLNSDVISPECSDQLMDVYRKIYDGEKELNIDIQAKNSSGDYSWYELTATTVFNRQGKPISLIGQTHNIDEKKKEMDMLFNNSTKDSLTMLLNHKTALKYINNILSKSNNTNMHALFMIDIDNFKYINETYGHTYGDTVLLEFSAKLQEIFSTEHVLGRIGGDEFIVFFKNASDLEEIKSYANTLRETFLNILSDEDVNQHVTGSIGISIYPQDGQKFGELFTKADMALSYAKTLGKNCFSLYSKSLMNSMDYLPSTVIDSVENNLHVSANTIIESTLLSNVVDVLFDAKRLDMSINAILKLIGNSLSLDNIAIYEISNKSSNTIITYEWSSSADNRLSTHFTSIPAEYAKDFAYYRESNNNIFFHNKAFCLPCGNSTYGDEFRKLHTYSILQCGLIDQGAHKGYIEACRNDSAKPWTKLEIDTLSVIFKIIGGYLLKLQTQKSAEEASKVDSLTHSSNMFSFIQIAKKLLSEHTENNYAVVYSDIKNFKYINETYGFAEGNRILVTLAQAMRDALDKDETYGRVNADRFVALMKFTDSTQLNERINNISNFMNNVTRSSASGYKISIITGIYPITEKDFDLNKCLDRADMARKTISETYKSTIAYFDNNIKLKINRKKELEDLLEDALNNKEFIVYYQPKFSLETNKICSAEALVRWRRPDSEIIPPNDFIPVFEENGMIVELDFYVCNLVCEKLRALIDSGKDTLPISINFSRIHLKDKEFVGRLFALVNSYNIPTSLIEIEITESALSQQGSDVLGVLNEIHNLGFKIAMDDFGTGLSSLNLLRDLPFDVIKLDKDFFQKGASTDRERTIITSIVNMGLALGMEIVSEGVETEEQAEFLRKIKCPTVQGYLYEKPIPADVFVEKYFS